MTKRKKKLKTSNIIIFAVITLNTLFTIAVLDVFKKVGSEPSTLISAVFAFTTVEIWALKDIKKTKIKKGEENNE